MWFSDKPGDVNSDQVVNLIEEPEGFIVLAKQSPRGLLGLSQNHVLGTPPCYGKSSHCRKPHSS